MKLLFSGDSGCTPSTLKRLMIIAEEIGFMDRPSISLPGFTTIGHASPLRAFEQALRHTEVKLSVYQPPSGPIGPLYKRYLEADLNNHDFRNVFLSGLRDSPEFARKFIQLEADYGQGTGKDLLAALLSDRTLGTVELPGTGLEGRPSQFQDAAGRRAALRVLLAEASFHVTNAMVVSENIGSLPVTDDPLIAKLMCLRASANAYVGGTSQMAPWLGLEIAAAVIPDRALEKLKYTDILDYRSSTKDAYRAWFTELNNIASEIDSMPPTELARALPKIKATRLTPKVVEYTSEMKSVADKLYGDLLKAFVRYPVPALSLAYCFDFSLSQAITAFAAALTPAIPAVIDYVQARRNTTRRHGVAYLIGLAEKAGE
jgi:hypothetical protein